MSILRPAFDAGVTRSVPQPVAAAAVDPAGWRASACAIITRTGDQGTVAMGDSMGASRVFIVGAGVMGGNGYGAAGEVRELRTRGGEPHGEAA